MSVSSWIITREYLRLSFGQLHLRRAGSGTNAIVLLHQVPSSSAMWDPVLPALARAGFHAWAFDLPGYGMSDPLRLAPGLSDYAGAVVEAMDALGISHAPFVGHHTGASVAMQLALDRPGTVDSLALWGIGLLDEAFAKELADEPEPEYDADCEELRRFWQGRFSSARPPTQIVAVRALAELMLCGRHRPDGHRAVGRTDHVDLLRRQTVPFLGMAGDREMLLDETRRAVELVPHGRYVHLGDAGIDVADEMPDRFVDAVVSFLGETRAGE